MSTTKEQNQYFKERSKTMILWHGRAEELAKAAEALWKSHMVGDMPMYSRPSLILMGLSLENLLKGILFKQGKYSVENGRLPKGIKSHDLNKLCRDAGIKIENTYEEKTFLQRVSENVDWSGKYPMPTNVNDFVNSKYGSRKALIGNTNDLKNFVSIYNKISQHFEI